MGLPKRHGARGNLDTLLLPLHRPDQSCTVVEIWCLKDNRVTTFWTFWSLMMSLVTWPFDLRWATSYGWSIVTILHHYGIMAPQSLDAHMNARTLRWFYTLSNAMHCIGQTKKKAAYASILANCRAHVSESTRFSRSWSTISREVDISQALQHRAHSSWVSGSLPVSRRW